MVLGYEVGSLPYFIHSNSKWFPDPNVKAKTVKSLKKI
jgi:hypothetical protein